MAPGQSLLTGDVDLARTPLADGRTALASADMEPALRRTVLFLAATSVGCGACGELEVSATFEGDKRLGLALPGRKLALTQLSAAAPPN